MSKKLGQKEMILNIDEDLQAKFKAMAAMKKLTMSEALREIIQEWVDKNDKNIL